MSIARNKQRNQYKSKQTEKMFESTFKINPERALFLNGGFTEKDANLLIQKLFELNQKEGEIFLQMNGNGGSFSGAKKIFDNILLSPNPVTGVVAGDAFSSIAVVLQACRKKYATKYSRVHIHHVAYPISFNLKPNDNIVELKEIVSIELNRLKKDDEILIEILSATMKMEKENVKKMLDEDRTLSASEALELLLIDEII